MKRPPADRGDTRVSARVAAAWSTLVAAHRSDTALRNQDRAFLDVMRELEVVREFVGPPRTIPGRTDTKHGGIAEEVQAGVSRAIDALYGRVPEGTFDGFPRTGPTETRVDTADIQSRYCDGLRNTLRDVASQAETYPDAGDHARYRVPGDQDRHRQLEEPLPHGRTEDLSERSAAGMQDREDDLEIEPGETSYPQVQRGQVHDTPDSREGMLVREDGEPRHPAQVEQDRSPDGSDAAAALGAMAGGGVSLAQAIWVKCREGRNPFRGEFSSQDWKDVGLVVAEGTDAGAVAGRAVYILTNSTALAAPFAGAVASTLMGTGALLRDYHDGKIDGDQFVEMSLIIAIDAALAGLADRAGQTLVPLPMLGTLIGSLGERIVASALSSLEESASALAARLAEYERDAFAQLDGELQALVRRLDAWFGNLERLAAAAFDPERNTTLRLYDSVQFAEAVGVPESGILRTTGDLDTFMKD